MESVVNFFLKSGYLLSKSTIWSKLLFIFQKSSEKFKNMIFTHYHDFWIIPFLLLSAAPNFMPTIDPKYTIFSNFL